MKDVVIVGALRTPIGCFQGTLARHSAVELGSVVVKALVERSGIDPQCIDEVILGQVLTAGTGQNPARQSAIRGGLPNTVSAITTSASPHWMAWVARCSAFSPEPQTSLMVIAETVFGSPPRIAD